jgi:pyruvate-ferredoxin/flavodoxin oxidoreductase
MVEGNEAVAAVAYAASEVIAIYPITPSSAMGEYADQWATEELPNAWGTIPSIVEMQSEGGAAGAVHGAVQAGALATTFTASQGLLLMIPNMYKIAGELAPFVMHVAARAIAGQALSIFGDHSDVMATRATGFAMLASGSVQEAADLALIAHAATLEARIPFMHFFDGFRTSHEIAKIHALAGPDVRALLDEAAIRGHRQRALSPAHPSVRGTAQNPDVCFQAREASNPFYLACPAIVEAAMERFALHTGRAYRLFDYVGAPDADRVVVMMGSGVQTATATAQHLAARGEKVGVLAVRLYRPFSAAAFVGALPASVTTIAVLDRTKEPGSLGEPLYLDVVTALAEAGRQVRVVGGRYGLASKEFTPGMAKAVFDDLATAHPRNHFTIGIHDDVTHTSLDWDAAFSIEDPDAVRAVFYGLGSDGTVGANKSTIKIIGETTDRHAQGYFVYDSKKAGALTVSHLRFGKHPIAAPYLIERATFVACHQFGLLDQREVLAVAEPGATVLLNSPYAADIAWDHLPREVQDTIVAKHLRLFVIDAADVARATGMGSRINTVMQPCFFALSGVLARDEAVTAIKANIAKTWGKRGAAVVQRNCAAVDAALDHLHEVSVPATASSAHRRRPIVPPHAPAFVQSFTSRLMADEGDRLPVSALPADGVYPSGTARWERRGLSAEIPVWDEALCIQCGKCVLVCPHAVVRATVYPASAAPTEPSPWPSAPARWRERPTERYTLAIAPDDCTGCGLCVAICPVKDKRETRRKAINMAPLAPIRDHARAVWDRFRQIDDVERGPLHLRQVKDVQLLEPLFEFSGACVGCGETPYVKLMSQLFGDRTLVANATGCSSIYGGNLPTTPWAANRHGRGPAWANSLFEDNAEFGLGMRLALDAQRTYAMHLLRGLAAQVGESLVAALLAADQSTEEGIAEQRARIVALQARLRGVDGSAARDLEAVAATLVRHDVWIVGGDGWAYDIGYGGLDHVLASGADVNVLVLDTEVYSNTGGQMSKATPRAAVAKFAAAGKVLPKKDLGLLMMTYGHIYVATVALGADDSQLVEVMLEAESYPGPSLVIAYSPCIAHGYDLVHGLDQQKAAVQSGAWPLYRFDPRRAAGGLPPLRLDSKPPSIPLKAFAYNETRYTMLAHGNPEAAERALAQAQADVERRWRWLEQLAAPPVAGATR